MCCCEVNPFGNILWEFCNASLMVLIHYYASSMICEFLLLLQALTQYAVCRELRIRVPVVLRSEELGQGSKQRRWFLRGCVELNQTCIFLCSHPWIFLCRCISVLNVLYLFLHDRYIYVSSIGRWILLETRYVTSISWLYSLLCHINCMLFLL